MQLMATEISCANFCNICVVSSNSHFKFIYILRHKISHFTVSMTFMNRNLPDDLIKSEEVDLGHHGIAITVMGGLLAGHLNSPFGCFLHIWSSYSRFLLSCIGFSRGLTVQYSLYYINIK